jgi:AhpD family alkylhydroperoxidase
MPELPKSYRRFTQEFPAVAQALDGLGAAANESGPLDGKTRQLVKLALAIGGRQQGAVISHTHRALEAGATPEEIKHVVVLAVTSVGFASAVAAYTWVNEALSHAPQPA